MAGVKQMSAAPSARVTEALGAAGVAASAPVAAAAVPVAPVDRADLARRLEAAEKRRAAAAASVRAAAAAREEAVKAADLALGAARGEAWSADSEVEQLAGALRRSAPAELEGTIAALARRDEALCGETEPPPRGQSRGAHVAAVRAARVELESMRTRHVPDLGARLAAVRQRFDLTDPAEVLARGRAARSRDWEE